LQTRVNAETESIFYAPDYSSPSVLHSQLRWTAVIRDWVRGSVAVSGGIHSGEDLAKALLVGADIGYICSVLHVRRDLKVYSGDSGRPFCVDGAQRIWRLAGVPGQAA
jgi:hypothetical protein